MNLTNCSFCGFALNSLSAVCENCGSPLVNERTDFDDKFQPNSGEVFHTTAQTSAPTGASFPPKNQSGFYYEVRNEVKKSVRCIECRTSIEPGKIRCFGCEAKNSKSAPTFSRAALTRFGVLSLVALFAAGFYFYTVKTKAAHSIIAKYETETGADKSLVYKNYRIKGKSNLNVRVTPPSDTGQRPYNSISEKMSFEIIYSKPGHLFIEHYRDPKSSIYTEKRVPIVKEVSDGVNYWQYFNFGFGVPKVESIPKDQVMTEDVVFGLPDYKSVLELPNMPCQNISKETSAMVFPPITIKTEQKAILTQECDHVLLAVQTADRNESTTLTFDEVSGLLLSENLKTSINGKDCLVTVRYPEYKTFKLNKKSFFGTKSADVLMPSVYAFTIDINEVKVFLTLTVETIETDVLIDNDIFKAPIIEPSEAS